MAFDFYYEPKTKKRVEPQDCLDVDEYNEVVKQILADNSLTMAQKSFLRLLASRLIVAKYEKFITILTTEMWGTGERAKVCQNFVNGYLSDIKNILDEGIEKGELKETNTDFMSKEILGFLFSGLYEKKTNPDFTVEETFKAIDKDFMQGLKNKNKM